MTRALADARFRAVILLAPLLGWLPAQPDRGEQDELPPRGGSSTWTPEEWTTSAYEDAAGYADRPDDQTLKEIRVEWQKPDLDALGNFCRVRGRLQVLDRATQKKKSVDWLQGLEVYMAMAPDARPDWSRGTNQSDTLSHNLVAKKSGDFEVLFDLRKSRHNRARARTFQFGVALAKHTPASGTMQRVDWTSRAPA